MQTKSKPKRVKALYNCVADNPDELTFSEGDVIIVDGEEDQEWWVSQGGATGPVHKGNSQAKQSGSGASDRLVCSAFHILWCLLSLEWALGEHLTTIMDRPLELHFQREHP